MVLVQVKKILKRIKKLEKEYDEAKGKPVRQERIVRMSESLHGKLERLGVKAR